MLACSLQETKTDLRVSDGGACRAHRLAQAAERLDQELRCQTGKTVSPAVTRGDRTAARQESGRRLPQQQEGDSRAMKAAKLMLLMSGDVEPLSDVYLPPAGC